MSESASFLDFHPKLLVAEALTGVGDSRGQIFSLPLRGSTVPTVGLQNDLLSPDPQLWRPVCPAAIGDSGG